MRATVAARSSSRQGLVCPTRGGEEPAIFVMLRDELRADRQAVRSLEYGDADRRHVKRRPSRIYPWVRHDVFETDRGLARGRRNEQNIVIVQDRQQQLAAVIHDVAHRDVMLVAA